MRNNMFSFRYSAIYLVITFAPEFLIRGLMVSDFRAKNWARNSPVYFRDSVLLKKGILSVFCMTDFKRLNKYSPFHNSLLLFSIHLH